MISPELLTVTELQEKRKEREEYIYTPVFLYSAHSLSLSLPLLTGRTCNRQPRNRGDL